MGTFLAGFAVMLWTLTLGGFALFAYWRTQQPKEPAKKQEGRSDRYVTHEQLELRLGEEAKKLNWANEEWYEKFNTLHARLSKRQQRAVKQQEEEEEEIEEIPSVLRHRRLGSV